MKVISFFQLIPTDASPSIYYYVSSLVGFPFYVSMNISLINVLIDNYILHLSLTTMARDMLKD